MMKGATKAWHGQSTKKTKKRILCAYPTWDFERRSGDSRLQTLGATQAWHGHSTKIKDQTTTQGFEIKRRRLIGLPTEKFGVKVINL